MNFIDAIRPGLTALVLPPLPWLLLVLLGIGVARRRYRTGALLALLGVALTWLSACTGVARALEGWLIAPPAALSAAEIDRLRAAAASTTAIAVLGGGRADSDWDGRVYDLNDRSIARLRYGLELSRRTGLPLAFSGGVGWWGDVEPGQTEAELAQRTAEHEYGRPLRWIETASRDTRQNAGYTVALLREAGVKHIVLVTHAYHMPRARRAFEQAAAGTLRITPAPFGHARDGEPSVFDWLPGAVGLDRTRLVLREALGDRLGY